jgi:hypothetical protein
MESSQDACSYIHFHAGAWELENCYVIKLIDGLLEKQKAS